MVKLSEPKSGLPTMAAIKGVSRSLTNEVTTVPKAAPMTTPTAKSTTLPRRGGTSNATITGKCEELVLRLRGGFARLFVPGSGDNTAMGNVTDHVLELDGGVIDAEVVAQLVLDLVQDALASRGRNVSDADVTREGVGFRADAPDMQIVHIVDAVNAGNSGGDVFQFHAARSAFQENIQAPTDNADG